MYLRNVAQKIAVLAWDTVADAPKTGDAANITAKISKDGSATAATNDLNPTELSATDAPGIYLFDMTAAEMDADLVIVDAASATANIDIEPIAIRTMLPFYDDGVAAFDRSTDSLQAIRDSAATLDDLYTDSRAMHAFMGATVLNIWKDLLTGAATATVDDATFTPTTTEFECDLVGAADNIYKDQQLRFHTGANAGLTFSITASEGTTANPNNKTKLTLSAMPFAPATGDLAKVYGSSIGSGGGGGSLTAGDIWDVDIVNAHGGADTSGLLLRVLGAAISGRTNNATLNALLGIPDTAGVSAVTELPDRVWDEEIVSDHGSANTAGLLVRALGNLISNRANNATLNALLGVPDQAGLTVIGEAAKQVFEELLANHTTTGTFGAQLQPIYWPRLDYTVDVTNTADEYTVQWFKNGGALQSGVTAVQIQVIRRTDGSNLFAGGTESMTQVGSTGVFKFDTSADRLTPGEAAIAIMTATIDGSVRTFRELIGRDST